MIDIECLKVNYDVEGWRVITDNWTKSNVIPGAILAINSLIEEIEKLRVNERASISVMRKWAAERVEMVTELESLRKNEYICLSCGLRKNDGHPKGDF